MARRENVSSPTVSCTLGPLAEQGPKTEALTDLLEKGQLGTGWLVGEMLYSWQLQAEPCSGQSCRAEDGTTNRPNAASCPPASRYAQHSPCYWEARATYLQQGHYSLYSHSPAQASKLGLKTHTGESV